MPMFNLTCSSPASLHTNLSGALAGICNIGQPKLANVTPTVDSAMLKLALLA